MPMYRVMISQTREYELDIDAPDADAAEAEAERRYRDDNLPTPEVDHDSHAVCRDCGDILNGANKDEGLPGYCGPCSIPEQQAREQGRSEVKA